MLLDSLFEGTALGKELHRRNQQRSLQKRILLL